VNQIDLRERAREAVRLVLEAGVSLPTQIARYVKERSARRPAPAHPVEPPRAVADGRRLAGVPLLLLGLLSAIDRLVHHSVIVELNVPSYRAEAARKARQGRVPAAGSEAAAPAGEKDGAAG
jgi:hypothetical protein